MRPPRRCAALLLGTCTLLLTCIVPDEEYCVADAQCQERAEGMTAVCDTVGHFCRFGNQQCTEDRHCTDSLRPACDRRQFVCAPCTEGIDAPCRMQADSKRPFCGKGSSGTRCVECRDYKDCPAERPICDANACRPCAEHSECGELVKCDDDQVCENSWVCIRKEDDQALAGRCAKNGEGAGGRVIYVSAPICGDANTGTTVDKAKCSINAAIDEARKRGSRYIRLIGSTYGPAKPIDLPEDHLIFIGAGRPNRFLQARVKGTGPLFQVSSGAQLVIDQLELTEENAGDAAITCSKGALTLLRSSVTGKTTGTMGQAGIYLEECDTVLDRNIIRGHAIGLSVNDQKGRSYQLLGNFITGNKITAIDLVSAKNVKLEASFNTVTDNGMGTTAGGVLCPFFFSGMSKPRFTHSIIAGNRSMLPEGQFGQATSCSFEQVVVGPGQPMAEGLINKDPGLTDNLHLHPMLSRDCCIDKVQSGPGLPDRDIDGDPRPFPRDREWDIGADEHVMK